MNYNDHLLTVPEAAKLLKISEATLLRRVRSKDIPAINLGKSPARPVYRFDLKDLALWAHEKKVKK